MSLRLTLTGLVLGLAAQLALAGEIKPFSQIEFDQMQRAGQPVLVGVAAGWCPTCKAQKPVVGQLSQQPAYKDVTVLVIDFDADKAALPQFKATMQSTLIAFKGSKEVGRSVGDASPAGIESLFKKVLN
ncbi:thioredoxin family protein [Roseateles paludis]|jgi:thiol-disulfide isomerase/thioredoxin|uniref:Thioredoxin family protein n=1 Tax=Roseateles paludis TaxID=3145238 RepID=A0ABV0G6W9_9BURK